MFSPFVLTRFIGLAVLRDFKTKDSNRGAIAAQKNAVFDENLFEKIETAHQTESH